MSSTPKTNPTLACRPKRGFCALTNAPLKTGSLCAWTSQRNPRLVHPQLHAQMEPRLWERGRALPELVGEFFQHEEGLLQFLERESEMSQDTISESPASPSHPVAHLKTGQIWQDKVQDPHMEVGICGSPDWDSGTVSASAPHGGLTFDGGPRRAQPWWGWGLSNSRVSPEDLLMGPEPFFLSD